MNIKATLKKNKIVSRNLSNNTQRIGLRLMRAEGDWVNRSELERIVPNATARVRDLRKQMFGGFEIECDNAINLDRKGDKNTFFYRINPTSINKNSISTLFNDNIVVVR